MKRYAALRIYMNCFKESDVLIFSGRELCSEAYTYKRNGCVYLDEPLDISLAFATGIAMNTLKRVFIFLGEGEFLKNLSALAQVGVSRCKNLFIMLFDNFGYQASGGHPSIFDALSSKMGFIFNIGVTVLNFTNYFVRKEFKEMKDTMDHVGGPLFMMLEVDPGLKKGLETPEYDYKKLMNDVQEFIKNEDMPTAMFTPPIDIVSLNIDALPFGGMNHGL